MFETASIIYNSAARDKLLANDPIVLDSVLPRLLAYRSLMVIRNIQMQQNNEKKGLKERIERDLNVFTLNGNSDPRYMTPMEV